MSNLDPALTDFTDPEGKLDVFGGRHAIWEPPSVEVRTCAVLAELAALHRPQLSPPYLVYPLAGGFGAIERFSMRDALQEHGWNRRAPGTYRDVDVLNAFVRLASADVSSAKGVKAVQAFAAKWGPLWRCGVHQEHGAWCHWRPFAPRSPYAARDPSQDMYPCRWYGAEEVGAFVERARLIKDILAVITTLKRGKTISVDLWNAILKGVGPLLEHKSARVQWYQLLIAVQTHAGFGREPRLMLDYDTRPKLSIVTELGFIHTVWLAVMQLLCNVTGVYQCSSCGNYYIRPAGRKRPKPGQNNYCEGKDCRDNKAAKREWARQKRTRP